MITSAFGTNGSQFAVSIKKNPTKITNKTTAIFKITIRLFVLAASLIPLTKIEVTNQVIKNAGRLNAKLGAATPASAAFVAAVTGSFINHMGG